MLGEGDPAPDFTLPTGDGDEVTLSELGGAPVVVYFYPKNGTFGCTREAGAAVVGVSADPPGSHRAFRAEHDLPFPLLSDEDGTARAAWDVDTLGMPGRVTFVVGQDGTIRHVFASQLRPGRHVEEALAELHPG